MNFRNFIITILLTPLTFTFAQPTNTAIDTNNDDQSEISIAVDPLDPDHLLAVWNDFRSGNREPGYGFSTDGGDNWDVDIMPNAGSYTYGFDPSAAFDRSGNAFYCYVASTNGLGPIFVSKTTNDGTNWSHTQVSNSATLQDKPFMAVDNTDGNYDGRIYVSWTDFSSNTNRIKFVYSTNGGNTFSSEIILAIEDSNPGPNAYLIPDSTTPGTPNNDFVQGSMPAVGPDGEVYVVWMEVHISGSSYLKIRKSTNGGSSFAFAKTVASFTWNRNQWGGLDYLNLPSLAVDQDNGYVYITYEDGTTPRIKFTRSTNGGSNWSSPTTIGNLGEKGEVFPWLAVDSDGKVAVTFMHKRNNDEVDCYITESYDHGANFRSPVKITSQSSDPLDADWTHHYQGMVLDDNGNNYVVWTDYRAENADPYFATINTPPTAPQNLQVSTPYLGHPVLTWSANQETDLDKYYIYRHNDELGWVNIGNTANITFTDEDVTCGIPDHQFIYKIRAKDEAGNYSNYSNTTTAFYGAYKIAGDNNDENTVTHYSLDQNYPNPFNPSTQIEFNIKDDSFVDLSVFDLNGKKVKTLVNGNLESGNYATNFDGSQLASGIYIYKIEAENFKQIKRMLLIK